MVGTRSVLDLHPEEPTLCIQRLAKPITDQFEMVIEAAVNGRDLFVTPDTGFSGFLAISEEDAESLELQTEELEERVEYATQSGLEEVALGAQGVEVEAQGKALTGDADVWPTRKTAVIGMEFLQGASITFEEEDYDVTFPEEYDVTSSEDYDVSAPEYQAERDRESCRRAAKKPKRKKINKANGKKGREESKRRNAR